METEIALMQIQIRKIMVFPRHLQLHTTITGVEKGENYIEDRRYIVEFRCMRYWDPAQVVNTIARWMAERTGEDRKCPGQKIRELFASEKEFQNRVYTSMWYAASYKRRMGKRGLFRLFLLLKDSREEAKDKDFRVALAEALIRKQGGKRSDNSWYWLGDHENTEITIPKLDTFDEHKAIRKYVKGTPQEYFIYGRSYLNLGKTTFNEQDFLTACGFFQKAIQIKRNYAEAYAYWGTALYHLAMIRNNDKLYLKSLRKWRVALRYKKDLFEAHYNSGLVLAHFATRDDKPSLHWKAVKHYATAVKYCESWPETYYNWGNSLLELGQRERDVDMLMEACVKYQAAIKVNSRFAAAYQNMGVTLFRAGELTGDKSCLEEAIGNYRLAVDYDPKNPWHRHNLGRALLKYREFDKKDTNDREIMETMFTGYILSMWRRQWDLAVIIAESFLFKLKQPRRKPYGHKVMTAFFDAMMVMKGRKNISRRLVTNLEEIRDKEMGSGSLILEVSDYLLKTLSHG